MDEKENVIFLKFRNDTPTEIEETLTCGACQNKTWKAVYANSSNFATLRCCFCGQQAGHFGWVNSEDLGEDYEL